jgi:hypothetical protein
LLLAAARRDGFSERLARFLHPLVFDQRQRTWSKSGTRALLELLVGEMPVIELSRAISVDRSTIARWLRGSSEPRVPELLSLVEECTHRTAEFVAVFVDPAAVPVVRAHHADLEVQRRLAYESPMSHAVLRALELDRIRSARRHDPDLVARAVGLPTETTEQLLGELVRAGQIEKRRGRWRIRRVLTVDTRSDPARNQALKRHWARVGLNRLERAGPDQSQLFSYNLFAAADEDLTRIRQACLEHYERVRQIVAESRHGDRVVLFYQALSPLGE